MKLLNVKRVAFFGKTVLVNNQENIHYWCQVLLSNGLELEVDCAEYPRWRMVEVGDVIAVDDGGQCRLYFAAHNPKLDTVLRKHCRLVGSFPEFECPQETLSQVTRLAYYPEQVGGHLAFYAVVVLNDCEVFRVDINEHPEIALLGIGIQDDFSEYLEKYGLSADDEARDVKPQDSKPQAGKPQDVKSFGNKPQAGKPQDVKPQDNKPQNATSQNGQSKARSFREPDEEFVPCIVVVRRYKFPQETKCQKVHRRRRQADIKNPSKTKNSRRK